MLFDVRQHFWYFFRRILKVVIHGDHVLPTRDAQTTH